MNSSRSIRLNADPHTASSMTKVLMFLTAMQDSVRNYIEVKVRHRDPLDDNGAHLIPSSRIITSRPMMNSLNRC
jgi:hypothetical protein